MRACDSQTLPWATPVQWQEANDTLAFTIRRHRANLKPGMALARRMGQRIADLDDPMTRLCERTCRQCTVVCCLHAHVYFDFKDLLYLHLGRGIRPHGQPIEKTGQTCRNWTSQGCRLPRVERPFICTWYLCRKQRQCLTQMAPSIHQFLQNSFTALKKGRRQLEESYIRITAALSTEAPIY